MFAKYDKEYISLYRIEKEPTLDIFLDVNKNFEFSCDEIKNYFSIVNSKDPKVEFNKYFYEYDKLDNLGQQAVDAFQNLKGKNG